MRYLGRCPNWILSVSYMPTATNLYIPQTKQSELSVQLRYIIEYIWGCLFVVLWKPPDVWRWNLRLYMFHDVLHLPWSTPLHC